MAYRRRTKAKKRTFKRTRRVSARRRRPTSRNRRYGSRSSGQTVRVVIEQLPAGNLSGVQLADASKSAALSKARF